MSKQIRCYGCGARIDIESHTLMVVCPICKDTIAVVQHERDVGAAETVPAFNATIEMGNTPLPTPLATAQTALHPAQNLGTASTVALPAQNTQVPNLGNASTVALPAQPAPNLGNASTVALPAQAAPAPERASTDPSGSSTVMLLTHKMTADLPPAAQAQAPAQAPRSRPSPTAAPAQPRSKRATTVTTKRPVWPFVLGIVLLGAGAGVGAYLATRAPPAAPPVARPPVDAGVRIEARAQTPDALLLAERAAIARADVTELGALLTPTTFAHGLAATEVAYTGPMAAAMLAKMLGGPSTVSSTWSTVAHHDDVAWLVDELVLERPGKIRKVTTSQLAVRVGTTWKVAAWHWAELVSNSVAFKLAASGELPVPVPITDQVDDNSQIYDAFRYAFASMDSVIEAFSELPDAIDVGSAPGERKTGIDVKASLSKLKATIRIRDGIATGRVSPAVGWAAANIDFTTKSGKITETFRVFAVLMTQRDGQWKIVLAQWSNGGPIP